MTWWFWWIGLAVIFSGLAIWLWIIEESTQAMAWCDTLHNKRKARKRKVLVFARKMFLFLALLADSPLLLALLILLAIIGLIAYLRAPKIEPINQA